MTAEKPRIEYDDDGKGYFSFCYIDKEGNVVGEPRMGLSFYNSYIYCGQKRMENKGQISLVRVDGLAKMLKDEAEMKSIIETNKSFRE